MTRNLRIQDSHPPGPLQLEKIKIGPQIHHRISQTISSDNRKILGPENLDHLTQHAHAQPSKGSQSGRWPNLYNTHPIEHLSESQDYSSILLLATRSTKGSAHSGSADRQDPRPEFFAVSA